MTSVFTQAEIERRLRNVKARIRRDWARSVRGDKTWLPRFYDYEDALLDEHPVLATHEFCGLCEVEQLDLPGTVDPRRDNQLKLGV